MDNTYGVQQKRAVSRGKAFFRIRQTQTEKLIDSLIITMCLIESLDVIHYRNSKVFTMKAWLRNQYR